MRWRELSGALLLMAAGAAAQERVAVTPEDGWYYQRIAVQKEMEEVVTIPEEELGPLERWVRRWSPGVRRAETEVERLKAAQRELPRLRYETQGERSQRFALFRCRGQVGPYELRWTAEEAVTLDGVGLVPTRFVQADGQMRVFGFPEVFHVEASESGRFDGDERVLYRREAGEASPAMRGYPVSFSGDGKWTRGLRLVVDEPFAPFRIGYIALSEWWVIAGEWNVAARGRVTWSNNLLVDEVMTPDSLTDGKTSLGLPVVRGLTERLGYHSEILSQPDEADEWIELTFADPREVKQVRLIPAQQRILPHTETFGFPNAHQLEGELEGRKVVTLSGLPRAADGGQNPVIFDLPEPTRLDRVTWRANDLWRRGEQGLLALAEIQVLDRDGENVAPEAVLRVRSQVEHSIWKTTALVDGLASEGRLLTDREWMEGLEAGRKLAVELKGVEANRRAALERGSALLLGGLVTLPVLILLGMVGMRWRDRRRMQRERQELRENLAADLHDELGGNLGSIVMLADQARSAVAGDEAARQDLDRVVEVAKSSRTELKRILRVALAEEEVGAVDMEREVTRAVREICPALGVESSVEVEREALSDDRMRDLLRLVREALHNVMQHSEATSLRLRLTESATAVVLTLEDDGQVAIEMGGELPSRSLRRRVKRLGAVVETMRSGKGWNQLQVTVPKGTMLK